MTTEEFEQWLRRQQAFCVRRAIKSGSTEEDIYLLLEKELLTEASIQSALQRYTQIKRGEIKIPDEFIAYLLKTSEEDDEAWEDE